MKCFGVVYFSLSIFLVQSRPQSRTNRSFDLAEPHAHRRHSEVPYVYIDGELRPSKPVVNNPEEDDILVEKVPNSPTVSERGEKPMTTLQRSFRRMDDDVVYDYEQTRILTVKRPHRNKGSIYDTMQRDGDFIFPEDTPVGPRFFKAVPSATCKETFCEEIDNYPGDYVVNVIRNKIEHFHDLFGKDELPTKKIDIASRINANDETPLCESNENVVYPKMAQNKDDEWLYIVNEGKLTQGVRVEMCLTDPQSCQLASSFPSGYQGLCKQKYIYRRMVALNKNGEGITENFKLPSCCTCFFKKTAESLVRFGSQQSPARP